MNLQKTLMNKSKCEALVKQYIKKKQLRKTDPTLYSKHLNKALSNLEFANFLIEEHNHSIKQKLPKRTYYDWCITIYYYAIYHTALTLLTKIGYDSKSHLATIATITLFYYHQDNILNKKDIDFLIEQVHIQKKEIDLVVDAKLLRERACYNVDETFQFNQATQLQKQTADFVSKIRIMLEG